MLSYENIDCFTKVERKIIRPVKISRQVHISDSNTRAYIIYMKEFGKNGEFGHICVFLRHSILKGGSLHDRSIRLGQTTCQNLVFPGHLLDTISLLILFTPGVSTLDTLPL